MVPEGPAEHRSNTYWTWAAAAVAATVAFVMRADLAVVDTLPGGGDVGGHVHTIAVLKDRLADGAGMFGWDHSWFGGYPSFGYYFPMPAWVGGILALALGPGRAVKILIVIGAAALPPAVGFRGVPAEAERPPSDGGRRRCGRQRALLALGFGVRAGGERPRRTRR
jgi:hypothetical protein